MISNSSVIQWGKLTSLNPNFGNISLARSPSNLAFTSKLQEDSNKNSLSSQYKCQIYQHKQEYFISYTRCSLAIQVNNKAVKDRKACKVHSGDRIMVTSKDKNGENVEYVFSAELKQTQKATLKRDREEKEDIAILEKKMKLQEDFENEAKCLICEKMIYECVSVVPCLHSFCMSCFMRHLRKSQECPDCRERFVEFRKNIFLNNLIEGYEESGYQRDRSEEECRKINEKLNTWRVFARFEYANGVVYVGKWKKCRKDGRGKMVFWNGDVYNGEWKNDYMEGKGKGIFADGNVYVGDFKGNKMEGKGKMRFSNGEIYEGEWKDNNKEGKGIYLFKSGSVYEGDYKGGQKEGEGRYRFPDGSVYEGDFKGNKREGKGQMRLSNGETYEGEWKNDEKEGQGEYLFNNGNVYQGEWRGDMREGKGEMRYSNGDVYQGSWKHNKREGKGRMEYGGGRIYEGEWENNEIKGKEKRRDKKKKNLGKTNFKKKRKWL